MAVFVKFNKFTLQMGTKCYDLGADTLKFALTNTAPTAATDTASLPGALHLSLLQQQLEESAVSTCYII
jgi:hypothetical protein